jgi:hypothetical protein
MIAFALQVMLFGMLGIFLVMAMIFASIRLLGCFHGSEKEKSGAAT